MSNDKVVVGGTSVTAAQMSEFWRQAAGGSITGAMLQSLLEHRLLPDTSPAIFFLPLWLRIWEKLGVKDAEAELKKLWLEPTPGFWDVYVPQGATPNKVVAYLRSLGVSVNVYTDDLDAAVTHNDRDPSSGSYRVRFRATIEADPEHKDKSADMLKEQGIKGITLLERLLLEVVHLEFLFLGLAHFLVVGDESALNRHRLDANSATLCSGSRNPDGDVPSVDWCSGYREVYVYWFSPRDRSPGLCARVAVS